jgi:hypothetical protein
MNKSLAITAMALSLAFVAPAFAGWGNDNGKGNPQEHPAVTAASLRRLERPCQPTAR